MLIVGRLGCIRTLMRHEIIPYVVANVLPPSLECVVDAYLLPPIFAKLCKKKEKRKKKITLYAQKKTKKKEKSQRALEVPRGVEVGTITGEASC